MFNFVKVLILKSKVNKLVQDAIATEGASTMAFVYLAANSLKSEYAMKTFRGQFPVKEYQNIFYAPKGQHWLDKKISEKC